MSGIVGTWRLVKAVSVGGDGKELPGPYGGDKAMGRVTFNADGRMMAVQCDGRPSLPDGASLLWTPAPTRISPRGR